MRLFTWVSSSRNWPPRAPAPGLRFFLRPPKNPGFHLAEDDTFLLASLIFLLRHLLHKPRQLILQTHFLNAMVHRQHDFNPQLVQCGGRFTAMCTNSWSQRSTSSSEEQVRVKNSQGMSPRRLVQQSRKIHESDAAISKPKSHTKQARVLPGRFCVKRSILFARRDQRSLQRKNTIGNCCSVWHTRWQRICDHRSHKKETEG